MLSLLDNLFPLKQHSTLILGLTILLSFILHFDKMGKDLSGQHVWRQSQTQWNIRNFYRHDSNILNPRVAHFNGGKDNIYRYEFPVMQWSIAMVQKVFGEDIWVTRICLFLLGVLTLFGLYQFLLALGFSPLIAAWSTWAFNFAPVFFYYTIGVIPDNLSLCASFWFYAFFFRFYKREDLKSLVLSGLMIMLAILAKLPFIILGLSVFWYFLLLVKTGKKKLALAVFMVFGLALVPPLLWYSWVIPGWTGNGVLSGVFDNQISLELAFEIAAYHLFQTLPYGLLNPIAALFFVLGIYFFIKNKAYKNRQFPFLIAGLLACLLYFTLEINMIHFVHDYYLFPFFPFVVLPLAYGLKNVFEYKKSGKKIALAFLLYIPINTYVIAQDYWDINRSGPNRAIYEHQEILKNAVPNGERCIFINDVSMFIFTYKMDKQGYVFFNDYLPAIWIDDMVKNNGVRYMYSDSRIVDERADVQPYLDTLLLQKGTVRVFKLKEPDSFPTTE